LERPSRLSLTGDGKLAQEGKEQINKPMPVALGVCME
jgi:hypothetical protein